MLSLALQRTIHTFSQPYFLRMILLCAGITLSSFLAFTLFTGIVLTRISLFETAWLDTLVDITGTFLTAVASWFLFPIVVTLIAAIFQEQVANVIDREEYADAPVEALPFWPELAHGGKMAAIALCLNLLCLPLYLTFVLFPFVYYSLNGYLLGREFFEMVAARYVGRAEAAALRRRHRIKALFGGMLIVLMSTLPFVNFVAPFAGIALMAHLYRSVARASKSL